MKRNSRRNAGFTLVEMAVTLAILTVLVAIGIPTISGWIDSAAEKRCISEMGMLRSDYAAHVVYGEFDIDAADAEAMLNTAAREALGKTASNRKYKDFQGNDCTVVFNADRTEIVGITCDKHGTLGISIKKAPSEYLYDAAKKILEKGKGDLKDEQIVIKSGIDSNAPDAIPSNPSTRAGRIRKALLDGDIDIAGINAKTWKIMGNDASNNDSSSINNSTIYWSGADTSAVTTKQYNVYAVSYNTATKKYQIGTMAVKKSDQGNYMTLLSTTFAAKEGKSYDTYEDAQAAYEAAYGTNVKP